MNPSFNGGYGQGGHYAPQNGYAQQGQTLPAWGNAQPSGQQLDQGPTFPQLPSRAEQVPTQAADQRPTV